MLFQLCFVGPPSLICFVIINSKYNSQHFGIKLEDSDDEGNKQQPSAKGTENVKLQKDYEDFKMKGLAAIEEGDQEDNTSTSSNDFFIIT
ncbi:hypothetical protein Tco_1241986 [Tanacetum coccineum]